MQCAPVEREHEGKRQQRGNLIIANAILFSSVLIGA